MKQAWKLTHKEVRDAIISHVEENSDDFQNGFYTVHFVLPKNTNDPASSIYAIVVHEGLEDDEALKQEADKWQCVS